MRREDVLQHIPDLADGERVLIAYHLYKKCFSIRSHATRKVIGYADRIVLGNARFIVSPSGRARVLREKMKNIHAFVEGDFRFGLQNVKLIFPTLKEAYYNPYQVSTFVDKAAGDSLYSAPIVLCDSGKVYYSLTDLT
jgi:hypothetical protein